MLNVMSCFDLFIFGCLIFCICWGGKKKSDGHFTIYASIINSPTESISNSSEFLTELEMTKHPPGSVVETLSN